MELRRAIGPSQRAPIPTRMLGITSKCCGGLRVAKQHPCVGKENWGGFSLGYFLMSFQNLTPLSDQPKADCPVWNKVMPTPSIQSGENLSIKEVGWRKAQSGERDDQNTPNPRLALRWSYLIPFTIEWGEGTIPECKLSATGCTGLPGLAAGKGRGLEKLPLRVFVLTQEESEWQNSKGAQD